MNWGTWSDCGVWFGNLVLVVEKEEDDGRERKFLYFLPLHKPSHFECWGPSPFVARHTSPDSFIHQPTRPVCRPTCVSCSTTLKVQLHLVTEAIGTRFRAGLQSFYNEVFSGASWLLKANGHHWNHLLFTRSWCKIMSRLLCINPPSININKPGLWPNVSFLTPDQ